MQTLEAERKLSVAVFLTVSGGFLDAFAYVGHGQVFANTMTGNVALLGVNLATANWQQAMRHLPPLVAFVVAVFVSHLLLLHSATRWLRRPAMACLCLEILFITLAASRLIPIPDFWLIPGISFVATLQTLAFTHLDHLTYTSVMTTGNLRRCAQKLFVGLIPRYDPLALRDARLLGTVSLSFLSGAVLGAFSTSHSGDSALWIADGLLAAAFCEIVRLARKKPADVTRA